MSDIAIRVENLGKPYRIGTRQRGYKTLRESITDALASPYMRWRDRRRATIDDSPGHPSSVFDPSNPQSAIRNPQSDTIWALKDVSFNVKQGEVVGIIGRNGAGKSTLLKILSRITKPTEGRAVVSGRVGSLLEVGTGFHPELTGRENIYLNGSILGMKKTEIDRKFDKMVAFAEVEKFIDTPVKHFSSGMYIRLAFAVAAHLDPEILLVDEVLAVGDAAFQKKSLGRMGDVAREGRTVLFVSHNMVAIQSLCQRAFLLGGGQLLDQGPASSVVSGYMRMAHGGDKSKEWNDPETAPGTDALRVKQVRVLAEGYGDGDPLSMQTPLRVETDYWILRSGIQLHITYHLINDHGIVVLTTGSPSARREPALYRASFALPGNLLNSGGYHLKFLIVQNENQVIYQHDSLASFTVVDNSEREHSCLGREPGVVQPPLIWVTAII